MANIMLTSNHMPPITSFEAYKAYVNKIPQMDEHEERELLEKLQKDGCLQSAQKLIMSQLKSVLAISYKYNGYGIPQEDLVQEGNIGLMKAVKNFNLSHQVRLYTYAIIWIKSEIQSYILKNWRLVKIATTKNLKKLFFGFKSTQKELIDAGTPKDEIIKNISIKLGVNEEETREIAEYFMGEDFAIDSDSEDTIFQLPHYETPEELYQEKHDSDFYSQKLQNNIRLLNDKQQQVINLRFYSDTKLTHKEISKILNVSSERVRQIEQEALEKLKKLMV